MEKLDEIIRERVGTAKRLHALHAETVLTDPNLAGLLTAYREAIGRTSATMRRADLGTCCGACAEVHGSCCFEGIGHEYDPALLFINLLLYCEVPESREISGGCYFVGKHGCKLAARYHFCLNYLCPDLRESLGPDMCKTLLNTVGRELSAGWELELALRQRFHLT